MTLLLLLTSSGGPKPVAAELNVFSGLTAAATDKSPAQALALVTAVADAAATLRIATDRAAEVIYVTSDLTATLRTSTIRPSANVAAVAGGQAIFEARPAVKPAGVVAATASLVAFLDSRTQRASALIDAEGVVSFLIPPRSLGGVATSAPGRAGGGSLTGGGRGDTGSASSAAGRSGSGSLTGGGRGTAGTATSAPGR